MGGPSSGVGGGSRKNTRVGFSRDGGCLCSCTSRSSLLRLLPEKRRRTCRIKVLSHLALREEPQIHSRFPFSSADAQRGN